ncbi:hypothetical protein BC941DRAFT_409578 [Chlamydoabsidia padenii]|nr:hypothetical protein BC941DRAFT_409578 [Chlamydoabsidia padenii]
MTTPPQPPNSQVLQQQQEETTTSSSSSSNPPPFPIPQLVVIRDQVHNTYKHPIIHYVFEDEPFPDISKDKLVVVDYDSEAITGERDPHVESYSPHFQISHCRLEQSTVNDQFDTSTTGLLNLILEGVSAPQSNEAIESLQPVRSTDNLIEMIFNFKNRNEMVKKVFQQHQSP